LSAILHVTPTTLITKNPELEEMFEAAIPQVAVILVDFDPGHPVIGNFTEYFKSVKAALNNVGVCLTGCATFGLGSHAGKEAVLSSPLNLSLLGYGLLSDIPQSECQEQVWGVVPLNLNGDILDDLITSCVVSCLRDGPKALAVMFGATPFLNGTTAELTAQMLRFNKVHTIYDPESCPPTPRHEDPSIFTPTTGYSG
ncbi:hypothetical protein B0H14DRAFT_2655451, partial [Mycena olivaceomarginata]